MSIFAENETDKKFRRMEPLKSNETLLISPAEEREEGGVGVDGTDDGEDGGPVVLVDELRLWKQCSNKTQPC